MKTATDLATEFARHATYLGCETSCKCGLDCRTAGGVGVHLEQVAAKVRRGYARLRRRRS